MPLLELAVGRQVRANFIPKLHHGSWPPPFGVDFMQAALKAKDIIHIGPMKLLLKSVHGHEMLGCFKHSTCPAHE